MKIYFRQSLRKISIFYRILPFFLRSWLGRSLASIVRFLGISISRSVRASTFTTLASTIRTGLIARVNIDYFFSKGL